MVTVNAIKCPKCEYIVYSRARHDMRYCPCTYVAIDGGQDYTKVVDEKGNAEMVQIELDTTEQELYDDWNRRIDKFGLIESEAARIIKKGW